MVNPRGTRNQRANNNAQSPTPTPPPDRNDGDGAASPPSLVPATYADAAATPTGDASRTFLSEQFNALQAQMALMAAQMASLEANIAAKMSEANGKLDNAEERVGDLSARVDVVTHDLVDASTRIMEEVRTGLEEKFARHAEHAEGAEDISLAAILNGFSENLQSSVTSLLESQRTDPAPRPAGGSSSGTRAKMDSIKVFTGDPLDLQRFLVDAEEYEAFYSKSTLPEDIVRLLVQRLAKEPALWANAAIPRHATRELKIPLGVTIAAKASEAAASLSWL